MLKRRRTAHSIKPNVVHVDALFESLWTYETCLPFGESGAGICKTHSCIQMVDFSASVEANYKFFCDTDWGIVKEGLNLRAVC